MQIFRKSHKKSKFISNTPLTIYIEIDNNKRLREKKTIQISSMKFKRF